jgi:hypothetical protein
MLDCNSLGIIWIQQLITLKQVNFIRHPWTNVININEFCCNTHLIVQSLFCTNGLVLPMDATMNVSIEDNACHMESIIRCVSSIVAHWLYAESTNAVIATLNPALATSCCLVR